jgi:hypothetical protein
MVFKKELEKEQRIDGFQNNFNILNWELQREGWSE